MSSIPSKSANTNEEPFVFQPGYRLPRGHTQQALYREARIKIEHILTRSFAESLMIKTSQIDVVYPNGNRNRENIIQRIFMDFMHQVINRCIEHNHKFVTPTRHVMCIYIKEKREEDVIRILRNPKIYKSVNLMASQGKLYEFVVYCRGFEHARYRSMRISHGLYQRITQKVNDGMRYFR